MIVVWGLAACASLSPREERGARELPAAWPQSEGQPFDSLSLPVAPSQRNYGRGCGAGWTLRSVCHAL